MTYLRPGDLLVVASIDRLARSLTDLRRIVDEIVERGAWVRFVKELLTFSAEGSDPRSDLMLGVLGSFSSSCGVAL
ncbi:recombinase family protein [Corynebacterium diphtheriae]|nr:recombinase family protein [Corynebacterium diphtheriae]CAB0861978.1 recombinase family protein [Corynebacterium diphtheriae]CAB0933524.1 recombinase family protein [Corynebacterium diphtheriae]CAB0950896.1 recombinase family protein [Corynebacterium diphtheriae]